MIAFGGVFVNNSEVATKSWVSDQLTAIHNLLDTKSNVGHTHSGSVTTANHNHGNPANANSGGGTYGFTVF
jgi:hypothetical protein